MMPDILPSCNECAKCCFAGPWLLKGIDINIPEEYVIELPEGIQINNPLKLNNYLGRLKQRENGSCVMLDEDSKTCTIYDNRPLACKLFHRGGPSCLEVLDGN